MDPIYVTGHRNPDTDSIVSAMAYAALKTATSPSSSARTATVRSPAAKKRLQRCMRSASAFTADTPM